MKTYSDLSGVTRWHSVVDRPSWLTSFGGAVGTLVPGNIG